MLSIEKIIISFDSALRTLLTPAQTIRTVPGNDCPETELTSAEKRESTALMRINHTGEVCAQALYQGQALTARDNIVQQNLTQAACEETEHLAWTERRIKASATRRAVHPGPYSGCHGRGRDGLARADADSPPG